MWLQNNISQDRNYQWIILNFSKTNNPRIKRIIFFFVQGNFCKLEKFLRESFGQISSFKAILIKISFFWHYFPIFYLEILKKIGGKDRMQKSFKLSSLLVKDGLKTNTLFPFVDSTTFNIFFNKNQLREIY